MNTLGTPRAKSVPTVDFTSAERGTPGGEVLRRSWQPVYRSDALAPGKMVPLFVLGEHLTLYRGESGAPYVVGFRCAHRNSQLSAGWVRGESVQCLYHGWTYDGLGNCVARPGEVPPGPCARVSIPSYPAREFLGLIYVYLGSGEPPDFSFVGTVDEGITDSLVVEFPCNWFQSYENVFDEAHAPFVHTRSESHADLGRSAEMPETRVSETAYGFERQTWSGNGPRRICIYPFPNHMRLMIGRLKGLSGQGAWLEAFSSWVPTDNENHILFTTIFVPITGDDAKAYQESRAAFHARVAAAEPVAFVAREILAGRRSLDDMLDHPHLLLLEDAVSQASQGNVHDRTRETLGRTDVGVVQMRRVFTREFTAVVNGLPGKRWEFNDQPRPTQGFSA